MTKATILIADDEYLVIDVAKAMFEIMEYAVITAEDGEQAFEIFKLHQDEIDLIILDISMPKVDGFTCLKQIREISDTPALISSGLSQILDDDVLVKNKAQGILPKPFSMELLENTVAKYIKK
jgi:CheY-like chemotaxis protein